MKRYALFYEEWKRGVEQSKRYMGKKAEHQRVLDYFSREYPDSYRQYEDISVHH